jgi:hypothetical protein
MVTASATARLIRFGWVIRDLRSDYGFSTDTVATPVAVQRGLTTTLYVPVAGSVCVGRSNCDDRPDADVRTECRGVAE